MSEQPQVTEPIAQILTHAAEQAGHLQTHEATAAGLRWQIEQADAEIGRLDAELKRMREQKALLGDQLADAGRGAHKATQHRDAYRRAALHLGEAGGLTAEHLERAEPAPIPPQGEQDTSQPGEQGAPVLATCVHCGHALIRSRSHPEHWRHRDGYEACEPQREGSPQAAPVPQDDPLGQFRPDQRPVGA